jgi:hypothetical protein
MNKIVMTFEAYQTYNDYDKNGNNTDKVKKDLESDVLIKAKHLTPTFDDKWISSINDVSDDKKGIKFEIKTTTGDTLHAFKIGRFLGSWEWYLNKKKMTESDIRIILTNKGLTPLERWELNFKGFDDTYVYSDSSRVYITGSKQEKEILKMYNDLSNADKRIAYKIYTESGRREIKPFIEFKGI